MKQIGEILKKHKRQILLYCIIGLLLASAAGVGVYLLRGVTTDEDKVVRKLYWNIDGKQHLDPEMGLSKRPADKDKAYRVTFAVDGEHVTYEIKNKRLIHQIDTKTLMGLEFDEEGVVVGVLDPKDVMADEIAPSYFVMSMEKDKIVTNGMQSGEGVEVEIPLTENTNIWNMKDTAEFIGEKGTPVKDDVVRAFVNEEGEVTDVFIIGVYNPFGTDAKAGWCEHCQQEVGWYEWSSRHTLPTVTAHWKLVYDIECNKRQVQIGEDQHVVLDLNGHTVLNTDNYRTYCTFNAGGSLSILDSSAEQSGRIVARGESNQSGMAVWVRYGSFNLYSGTLDASQATITGYGTTVSLDVNTTFNMYGGTIIGGTTKTAAREDGKGYIGGFGGAVSVANGATFNMYGGTIKDGNAVWLKKADGVIIGGGGGNVYIRGGGTMNMEGGEILGGKAQQMAGNVLLGAADAVFTMKNDAVISGGQITELGRNSGNVHIWAGATMNMEGGTIKDGVATGAGGNVTVYGTLNMSGGQITGGKIKEGKSMNALKEVVAENANIHCFNGNFNMTGGYIDGYVRIASSGTNDDGTPKTSKVSISGDSQITGGKKNVTLFGGVVIDMGKLGGKANITMTSGGFVTGKTLASNVSYVHSDLDGLKAEYVDSKIFIGKMQCVCGGSDSKHYGDCDGKILPWKPWSDEASLPRDNDNYFLVCDVTLEKEVSVATDSTLRMDLNGHKINGAVNKRVFQVTNAGSKLIVTDNSEKQNGRIVAKGTEAESFNGMCIWLGGKENQAAMYAGILDASGVVSQKGGPAVFVAKNNHFDMFAGTIRGGQVVKNEQKTGGTCGTIYVNGSLDMWSGLVYGGKAEGNAGNIYVANGATFNLHGGNINGGYAEGKGGNIHSHGTVNLYEGAMVEKGESVGAGGNILIGETSGGLYGILNMYGGTVQKGKAGQQGGNLAFEGNFRMTGGTVVDGTSGKKNSENVAIWQRQKTDSFEMSGGKINGGVAFMTNSAAPETSIIKAVLSGTAVIKSPKKETVSLLIPKNNQITIGDLKAEAEIYITGSGTIAKDAVATDVSYVKLDAGSSYDGAVGVTHCALDDTLFVGMAAGPGTCICGHSLVTSGDKSACIGTCDGVWHNWTPTNTLPTKSGYYYMVKDIETTDAAIIPADTNISLDLHGHKVTNKNEKRLITISSGTSLKTTNTKLNLVDHVGDGTMYLTKTPNGSGGIILLQGEGNEVSIYSGTYDASAVNYTSNGVAIAVTGSSASAVHMYGGTIIGGTTSGNGGAVYVANTNILEMIGGRITSGRANLGGNVYLAGSMKLSGGAVISGGAKNTEGAVPTGGSANVYIKQGTSTTNVVQLDDCTVEGIGVIEVLQHPIQVTSETILCAPESGAGLVVANYVGTWMTWSGPEYTAESQGRIVTSSTPGDGAVVIDKGVLLADRSLFRERVAVKDGLKLMFAEVTLDSEGNPTGKGKIVTTNSGAHVHCACGGMTEVCGDGTKAHKEIRYTSITSETDLPNTAGNYHLKHNVNLSSTETVLSGEYNLCLNGYQLTGTTVRAGNDNSGYRYGSRVFNVTGGTLNVTNCAEGVGTIKTYSKWQSVDGTETITGKMNFSGAGGVFLIDGGNVNCYKIHLDASDWFLPNGNQWKGSIAQVKTGTLTGYDCTYVPGKRTNVNLGAQITETSRVLGADGTPFISGTASANFADLALPVTAFKEKE